MDHPPLQPFQSSVGLAHPAVGHLHRYFHSVLRCLSPQRPGGAEKAGLRLLMFSAERGRSDGGHYVYS